MREESKGEKIRIIMIERTKTPTEMSLDVIVVYVSNNSVRHTVYKIIFKKLIYYQT